MFNLQCFVTKAHLYSDKMELHETNTKQVNSHFNLFYLGLGLLGLTIIIDLQQSALVAPLVTVLL